MPVLAREFWRWWVGQLLAWLPDTYRRFVQGRLNALVIATDFTAARIEKGSRIEWFGAIDSTEDSLRRLKRATEKYGRDLETRLELPADAILEKQLTLPLAAERDLDRVLAFEMDRETPFAADELYWVSHVRERDTANKRLAVSLAMVPKAPLAEPIVALERAGLRPAALVGAKNNTVIPIDHGGARRDWSSRATVVAAALCALLAIAAVAIPFVQQGIALDNVERRIEMLQPRVVMVERLRSRVEGDRLQAEGLTAERAQFGDPLAILAAVTAALPDDTHLTEFDFSLGKVTLTGQSKAASHLIADIARNPNLRDPVFASPVTRSTRSDFDVFSITARMR